MKHVVLLITVEVYCIIFAFILAFLLERPNSLPCAFPDTSFAKLVIFLLSIFKRLIFLFTIFVLSLFGIALFII